jgi:hypothetical protein
MRTDCIIDKCQVRCPNASHLGYDKWKAQVGDLVLYSEGTQRKVARMIGRITYAPELESSDKPIKNWILGIALTGELLEHTYERWIDPKSVIRVESIREQRAVLEYFLSDEMLRAPIDEVRKCSEDGWSTLARYREWKKKRDADMADYNARHPHVSAQ